MQARTAALAEEAALDYRREGLAHYYQLHFPPAITAYETALAQLTRASHPQTWAMLQNDLAIALQEHGIRTDPATGNQLLARAVSAYRAALEVRTREALPQHWATTQNNLANALMAQGDKALTAAERQRLYREAEAAYLAALEVRTKEALPYHHQRTQKNLGILRAKMAGK